MGSRSLTRDRTQPPCIRSTESQPLDHQGIPRAREILTCHEELDKEVVGDINLGLAGLYMKGTYVGKLSLSLGMSLPGRGSL